MKTEIAVPDVNPVVRMAEIKDQQIAEIIEYNERKKSPYRKWIQMNNDEYAREAEDWLIAKSPAAYRIFRFLVSNMDNYNAVICSYKVLQEKFACSQATVKRAIQLLKQHKYIDVARTGGANIYMINKHLYWNSWGTNFAYAEFDAKVIISASEQDDDIQTKIKTEIKRRQEVVQSPPTFREQTQQIQQNEKIN
jgi:hypothetical protein